MTTQTISQTVVEYNRSTRQWEARNGTVTSFPAGKEGKKNAQLHALQSDCDTIFNEVLAIVENTSNHPQAAGIEARAIRAGFLVRDGHLLPPRGLDKPESYVGEVARVKSQSEPDTEYAIVITPEQRTYCDCRDWHNGHMLDVGANYYRQHPDDPERPRSGAPKLTSGDYACKHILAVLIVETLESKDAPQPHQPEAERDALRRYAVEHKLT
ncbi:MAG: hypothetical protein GY792_05590 [Gammaproteobacteria bacterium]|nr:hypothetical protein [Gammaproteobacteria bacterium]